MKKAITVTAKTVDVGKTLSGLGISTLVQARRPSPIFFPTPFNNEARPIWSAMFQDELFNIDLGKIEDTQQAWLFVVTRYFDLCESQEVPPYLIGVDDTYARSQSRLEHARRTVCQFYNLSRFFETVQFKQGSDRHKYIERPNGNLELDCVVRVRHTGKGDLASFLTGRSVGLKPNASMGFSKISQGVQFFVTRITNTEAVVGYRVLLLGVDWPDIKPKAKQREQLDRDIFLPLVKAYPVHGLSKRILF